MNADVVIVGAGPAGIFTALEMIKKGSRQKIVMVEKGQPVEKRHCPKDKTKKCVNCKPYCHITTGFSGAGAFSDGKLSLSYEVGGDLPTLIGADLAQETIDYADQIYLEFGADEHIEGLGHEEERKEIRRRAIQAGLKLVDCPIRHMGTEKAQAGLIYKFILIPLHFEYLQTIVFILVIAALVQFVEMFLKKAMPALYNALGVYLPLITTNCAVLGVALTNVQKEYSIAQGVINGIGTSAGFALAIVILAGLREKMEYNDVTESFQGTPIVLITASLMAIAFFGFSGLI